jgi:LmbE family N-acetylglucosaminyl deacetylase
MKVLVVVAHPDDEVLGCGATIAKLAEAGNEVSVLLPVRRCDPRGRATWDALLRAFHASCNRLSARPIVADPLFDETAAEPRIHELHDLVLPFVEESERVLTHWPGDVNQVHRGVARAVEIATRPFRRRRDVSCFEIPTSTDQTFGGGGPLHFSPTEYVVLDERHARAKCEAAAEYGSELVPGRSPDDLERKLRVRGAEVGATYAEAFVVARRFS